MKRLVLALLLLAPFCSNAQIRWADSVLDFSTNYGGGWDVTNILGTPNVYPGCGDIAGTWAPSTQDNQREFVEVRFPSPAAINRIYIYETCGPSAVDTVYIWNPNTSAWQPVYAQTASLTSCRILNIALPLTSFPVSKVRIAVNAPLIPGWNEYDAVGIANIGDEGSFSNPIQTITGVATPQPFTNIISAFNGDPSVVYQWQRSYDNNRWMDVAGATTNSYTTATYSQYDTIWFRRRAVLGIDTGYAVGRIIDTNPTPFPNTLVTDGTRTFATLPAGVLNGTTTFTIEGWVKTNENRSSGTYWQKPTLIGTARSSGPDNDFGITTNNGMLGLWSGIGVEQDIQTTVAINDNNWHHVAAVKQGGVFTLYADGVAIGSISVGVNSGPITTDVPIGIGGSTANFTGYGENAALINWMHQAEFAELRFSDIARYNGAFTPATSFTADANTVALYHFNGTCQKAKYTDASANGSYLSGRSDYPSCNTGLPFNRATLFNGNNQAAIMPSGMMNGLNVFTAEGFIKTSDTRTTTGQLFQAPAILAKENANGGSGDLLVVTQGGYVTVATEYIGGGLSYNSSKYFIADNQWHHWAISADGNVWRFFVDGIVQSAGPVNAGLAVAAGQHFALMASSRSGYGADTLNYFHAGNLDEVRFSNNARYTASFAVPGLMTSDGNTIALLHNDDCLPTLSDASPNNNNAVLVNIGNRCAGDTSKPGSGNAITFDGTSNYITYENSVPTATNNFSFDCWVNPNATIALQVPSNSGTSGLGGQRYALFPHNGPTVQTVYGEAGLSVGTNGIAVYELSGNYLPPLLVWQGNVTGWTHVAVVYINRRPNLYVNGILVATGLQSALQTVYAPGSLSTYPGQYGGIGGGVWGYFSGSIDEVRIWNTPLTQTQIRDRMCRKIGQGDPLWNNLINYYNFDEDFGTPTITNRKEPASNFGTLVNAPTRIISGAPIGNISAYTYGGAASTVSLTNTSRGDMLTATLTGGNADGVQVYGVTEQPNTNGGIGGLTANNGYFGTFPVNGTSPALNVDYNYTGIPGIVNENALLLYTRSTNAIQSWIDAGAAINTVTNDLTVAVGGRAEYKVGEGFNPGAISGTNVQCSVGVSDTISSIAPASGGTAPYTYQWQDSVVSGSWQDISGAGSSYYIVPQLTLQHFYRRKVTDAASNVGYSNVIERNPSAIGNPAVFGSNTWNVYAYNGQDYNLNPANIIYRGYYSDTALLIDTRNRWDPNYSPSLATGYQGCPVNSDFHTWVMKRHGFPAGPYVVSNICHDDDVNILVNGVSVMNYGGAGCNPGDNSIGYLDSSSNVEIRTADGVGGAYTQAYFVLTQLQSGSIGTNTSICNGETASLTNVANPIGGYPAYTYQWQDSAIGGSWQNIAAATATSYATPTLTQTTWYRRIVKDTSNTAAYSNIVVIAVNTIAGDPLIAGSNQWNFYCYNGGDINLSGAAYRGYYPLSTLAFNTQNEWNANASPSSAAGYLGCPVNADNFTMAARRKGFPANSYTLFLNNYDDVVKVLKNNVEVVPVQGYYSLGTLSANDSLEVRLLEYGGAAYMQVTLSQTPLIPGTIVGDESICGGTGINSITNSVAAYGGSTANYSYRWQDSIAGQPWVTVAAANGLDYQPPSITQNHWYRRQVLDGVDSGYTNIIHKFYSVPVGDTAVFGNNVWNIYGYANFDLSLANVSYRGYYVAPSLNYATTTDWGGNSNPSTAPGYQGCAMDDDNFTFVCKRTGFVPDNYTLNINNHDDWVVVYKDGVNIFQHNSCCDAHPNISLGALNATSKIEIRVAEGGGGALLDISFNTGNLQPGLIGTSQSLCGATVPSLFTNVAAAFGGPNPGGIVYQWQDSIAGGAWVDISGAQAATYQEGVVPQSTWYRRRADDGTTTAYSNIIAVSFSAVAGNSATFGTNVWNFYAYEGNSVNLSGTSYRGFYTDASVDINTQNQWNIISSPSSATGYAGCAVPTDNFTLAAKRKGFTPGLYNVVVGHDDDVKIIKDGNTVFTAGCCGTSGSIPLGNLTATTELEIRLGEATSTAYLSVAFTNTTTYTITSSAGTNGSITPNGIVTVGAGLNQAYTITPDPGYSVQSVIVDGVNQGALTSYTFFNVLANHTIAVAFAPTCITPSFTTCPSNITLTAAALQCSAVATYTATTSGTSPAVTYILTGATTGTGSGTGSGLSFNSGVTTVSLSATNGCGNANCSFTVTVNTNIVPAVAISANPGNTICSGVAVTFTATPTNGGASPVYQWMKNGVNAGSGISSYTDNTLANNDTITVALTSSYGCASPQTVTSNKIVMAVTQTVTPTVVATAYPGNQVCEGTTVLFTAAGTNGGTAPSYAWFKNSLSTGATGTSYITNSFSQGDVITAKLTSNAVCASALTVTSNNLEMALTPVTTLPTGSVARVYNQTGGMNLVYADNSCQPITSITTANGNTLGTTTTTLYINPSLTSHVSRYVDVAPANNLPATIKLYFLQSEFDAYNVNAAANSLPLLPANPTDPAVNNIIIEQYHGGPASGNSGPGGVYDANNKTIISTNITKTWNAANQYWEISFPVTSFSGHFLKAAIVTPLALRLGTINAVNTGKSNLVTWTTVHEDAGDYFDLERSSNGKDFVQLGTIRAHGAGSYNYTDIDPFTRINYYRLKMIEANGNFLYSQVVTANVARGELALEVYPNPAKDVLIIKTNGNASTAQIIITDVAGHEVRRINMQHAEEQVDITTFAQGVYFVKYTEDVHTKTVSIVKQ